MQNGRGMRDGYEQHTHRFALGELPDQIGNLGLHPLHSGTQLTVYIQLMEDTDKEDIMLTTKHRDRLLVISVG